jgi:hypothetical protein
MQQAVEALKADDLPTAEKSQGEALRHLIRARQNVRKMLSDPQNASAVSAENSINSSGRSSAPRSKRKEDEKREKPPRFAAQLDKLAQQQRQWSEQVRSTCSNPSQVVSRHRTSQSRASIHRQANLQSQPQSPASSPSRVANRPSHADSGSNHRSRCLKRRRQPEVVSSTADRRLLDQFEQLRKRHGSPPPQHPPRGWKRPNASPRPCKKTRSSCNAAKPSEPVHQGEQVAERLEQLSEHSAFLPVRRHWQPVRLRSPTRRTHRSSPARAGSSSSAEIRARRRPTANPSRRGAPPTASRCLISQPIASETPGRG